MTRMVQHLFTGTAAALAALAAGLFVALNAHLAVALAEKAADAGAAAMASPAGAFLLLGACAGLAIALKAIPRT